MVWDVNLRTWVHSMIIISIRNARTGYLSLSLCLSLTPPCIQTAPSCRSQVARMSCNFSLTLFFSSIRQTCIMHILRGLVGGWEANKARLARRSLNEKEEKALQLCSALFFYISFSLFLYFSPAANCATPLRNIIASLTSLVHTHSHVHKYARV